MDWSIAGQVATGVGAIALAWWIWPERRRGNRDPLTPWWPRAYGRQDAPGSTIAAGMPQESRHCGSCGQKANELHHYHDVSVCPWCHAARQRRRDVERHLEEQG